MVTKKQFLSYEDIRLSGVTNMWNTTVVSDLSGLSREQCLEVIKNYSKLKEKYLG